MAATRALIEPYQMGTKAALDCFRKLNQAQAGAQRGFYFDTVTELPSGLTVCLSNSITDSYWNYAYAGSDIPAAILRDGLARVFSAYNRTPALLLLKGERDDDAVFTAMFKPTTSSVWMATDSEKFKSNIATKKLRIVSISSPDTIRDAEVVFADALTSPGDDGIGYTGLPPEYNTAFRRGLKRAADFGSHHLIGYEGTKPVAIASANYSGGLAGIYNVAVRRNSRQRGYGMAISSAALSLAARKSQTVFLQTEAETPVEAMYEKVGFKTVAHSEMWYFRD